MRILLRVLLLIFGFFVFLKPEISFAQQNQERLKSSIENVLSIAFNYGPESLKNDYSSFFSDKGWESFLESYKSKKDLFVSDWLILVSANEPFTDGFVEQIESANDGYSKNTKRYKTNIEIIYLQGTEETKKYMEVELTSHVERKNRQIINHKIMIDKVSWISPFESKNPNSAP
jgi:hypothetical protein